jgi:ABC-type nitrate/sulfonate/bicarbonate transport system ATPase subunit
MRQRVALARTVLTERPLLLLDEPFGALDSITRRRMQELLLDLWSDLDRTILLVTHDVDEAVLLSDRIYVLRGRPGEVVDVVDVALGRPRHGSVALSEQYFGIRSRLLASLELGQRPS